jgi:hypothetical protein
MFLAILGVLIIICLVGMLVFIFSHLDDFFYGVGVSQKRPALTLALGVILLGIPYGLSYWLESASREFGAWFDVISILSVVAGVVLLCMGTGDSSSKSAVE